MQISLYNTLNNLDSIDSKHTFSHGKDKDSILVGQPSSIRILCDSIHIY